MAWIFKIEKDARECSAEERLAIRQCQTKLHWDDLHAWLQRERQRVPDGSGIACAIDEAIAIYEDDGVSASTVSLTRTLDQSRASADPGSTSA